jgi:hypothetical protein
VRPHLNRVLDASALIDLFAGHDELCGLLDRAEAGEMGLLLPTTAIAEAEADLDAGPNGWEPILLTAGVRSLPLSEHTAIEIGRWPGALSCRHAAHEAHALRAVIVTRKPGGYEGLHVPLRVV